MTRSHVPFDDLWSMAIEVPYSYLLRDDDLAWTCGQLALDPDSKVVAPGDLRAQSHVVCDYIDTILERAGLANNEIRRLYLYYVHSSEADRQAMLDVFANRIPRGVHLVPIEVPHFYYDGVVLEVDVFWGGPAAGLEWVAGPAGANRLSEHIIIPPGASAHGTGSVDPGAALLGGPSLTEPLIAGVDAIDQPVHTQTERVDDVLLVMRRSGVFTWIQGRSTNGQAGLVEQTESIMRRFDETLTTHGLSFLDVVKSTTHYAGGSSADDLHDNMSVRNAYYRSPGPASTGIPVYGFADPASKVVVDLTLVSS